MTNISTVQRDFVTVQGHWGSRQVHYRRAGSGPWLLLLHQSPQSSRELLQLMEKWAAHFTVVAPDTPGYGLSDPLGVAEAELADFARATIEFMDVLGAGRFGVYGFHTGGMIGMAIADAFPDRVSALACNGVVVPATDELAEILRDYLPAFEPRWDGGHLAWLWSRIREQTIFFPWHKRTLAGRMDFPMPDPQRQQNSVLEFLRASAHYRVAYRAAFVFRAADVAPRLHVPAVITAARWDPLYPHLRRITRYPDEPGCLRIVEATTPDAALAECLRLLSDHLGDVPAAARCADTAIDARRSIVRTGEEEWLLTCAGPRQAPLVLIVHGSGSSAAAEAELIDGLAGEFRVMIADLPGHGESSCAMPAQELTVQASAQALCALLAQLDMEPCLLAGVAGGTAIALELASLAPDSFTGILLLQVPAYTDAQRAAFLAQGLPAMTPEWSGGHLLRCWHMVRDGRLYFPWFQRDQAGIRWQPPELDDTRIQREVTEYLKAEGHWQALRADELRFPLRERMALARQPLCVAIAPTDAGAELAGEWARAAGCNVRPLPEAGTPQGPELCAVLRGMQRPRP